MVALKAGELVDRMVVHLAERMDDLKAYFSAAKMVV